MRKGMKEEFDFTELYHTAAANIIESDKHKRRPPTPGQTCWVNHQLYFLLC
jgi:hypothetical protein